ncbi:hypothetical protein COV61_04940 [Candidatus Micrarchaeota archaeon CG11_big_fil_rev_8_21_14_0_20_47_5]|nr:MAG: hypothetical protein AUJ17_00350 [Candidatus Micrarchaeota archaeon CG1_02_47_40]PIN82787.1 MAG: hypothetical protein COV61_04940 [Candidatus Micrarchaeota archaeon CG11_big_fil_rev_8_21_14_0_20_47_5]
MKKGQYFSFDAIAAVLIFILALSILGNYWFGIKATMNESSVNLQEEALAVSDGLLTPGQPEDWDEKIGELEEIGQIGFAQGFGTVVLDANKIIAFRDYADGIIPGGSYLESKKLLNTIYDYTIEINTGVAEYNIGIDVPSSAKNVAVATRGIILLNGENKEAGTMKVYLWE